MPNIRRLVLKKIKSEIYRIENDKTILSDDYACGYVRGRIDGLQLAIDIINRYNDKFGEEKEAE